MDLSLDLSVRRGAPPVYERLEAADCRDSKNTVAMAPARPRFCPVVANLVVISLALAVIRL
jgi:hypothetical protein